MELKNITRFFQVTLICVSILGLNGCESLYFSAMEKVGVHKRDILKDRIEDARDAQEESKEQFVSALDEFKQVLHLEETSLEKRYKSLQAEYDASEEAAQEVHDKIAAVESVSEALFKEWQKELSLYTSPALKRSSAARLKTTRKKYAQLIVLMKRAESKMAPVLNTLRDQTLFLKHNLNAQAISTVRAELGRVEQDVDQLVIAMEKSILQANAFIQELK